MWRTVFNTRRSTVFKCLSNQIGINDLIENRQKGTCSTQVIHSQYIRHIFLCHLLFSSTPDDQSNTILIAETPSIPSLIAGACLENYK